MSQADLHSDSSVAGLNSGMSGDGQAAPTPTKSGPPPPPIAAPPVPPAATPLPPAEPVVRPVDPAKPVAQKPVTATAAPAKPVAAKPVAVVQPAAKKPSAKSAPPAANPVPPPPPPRSTLPPLRKEPDPIAVASGVGSAKGVRWRGELASIERQAVQAKEVRDGKRSATENPEEVVGEQELEEDKLMKEMPSWLVSTIIHMIILLVLALMNTTVGGGVQNMLLEFGYSAKEAPVDLAEFSIEAPTDTVEIDTLTSEEVEEPTPEIFDSMEVSEVSELAPVELGTTASEEVKIAKPMFNGRTGAMRKALLAIYGGTAETEEAVKLGLLWLKKNQRRDGSWSMKGPYDDGGITENRCAATAMALLAFCGDGSTHLAGEYQEQVEKGLKFLIAQQSRSGFMADKSRGHEKMYSQAQATIVLCELYAMTKDSWLRPRAQLAIDYAMDAQSDQGGWRYEPNFDSDLSVTGWFVMALKSAQSGGLEVHTPILANAMSYLDDVESYQGAAYGYQSGRSASPSMTAEGLLCRQYLGWVRENKSMIRGVQALIDGSPFNIRDRDVYYWYYATQTLHHFGGSPWRLWNEVMSVELPKAQVKSGKEAGSWAPQQDAWGRNHGRLYTTCLSIFCLETYYRHMPLYNEGNAGQD